MSDLFYLQDSRSYVGNDVLWWAEKGQGGYTTDLRKARLFSTDEAQRYHNARETDIPWPKEYIEAKTRPAVDMQYIKRDEALSGTGITIIKPTMPPRYVNRCGGCNRFVSDWQVMDSRGCPNCGTDNRP
jgi:hypothetical protein